MYPVSYYENFMRYEASDRVFVAMPFTTPFLKVYDEIIQPAVSRLRVNKNPLSALIINRGTTGAADIHERIFDAIMHSRLVLADMTVQASSVGTDGKTRWQANANVAYEVGLASAWRNPEDVILIHQEHAEHAYSFDIQNLRHVAYNPRDRRVAIELLVAEMLAALKQSSFLASQTFLKVIQSISPSAVQYMHQESGRPFPLIGFSAPDMPIMDTRVHAVSELLSAGVLKNRNVVRAAHGGVSILYEWTELGLRVMQAIHAITAERRAELAAQLASVPPDKLPPVELQTLRQPESKPAVIDTSAPTAPEQTPTAS